MDFIQANSEHLLRHQPTFSGWFAALGVLTGALTLGWYLSDSSLFLLQLPIFLCSILFGAFGWIGVLRYPPRWLPLAMIVFIYFVMDFTLRSGNVSGGSFDIQSILKGTAWVFILSFGLANGIKTTFDNRLLLVFFLYTLFAFFSAFYSKALFLGLGSGIALLALSSFSGVIGTWSKTELSGLWRGLFIASVVMAALSLVLYFVAPQMAIDNNAGPNRLRGLTGSGNSLGPIMSIGVFAGVYIWSSYKRPLKIFTVLGIAFLLAALALSQSRSSMIGLIAGFLLVAALSNLFAFMLTAALGSIGTWTILQPGLLDSILGGLASLVSRSGRVAEITSFTGRSEIWAGVFAKWLESPWFGYGLGSPRIIVAEAYRDQWGNTHESAHNWLLESLISFGIAGTTLLVIFLGLMAWRLWTFKQNDSAPKNNESIDWPLVLCMRRCFVFCLISGLMEKAFAGMPNPSLILLTCIAGSCVALTRQGHVASVFAVASPIIFSAHLRPLAIGRNGAAK